MSKELISKLVNDKYVLMTLVEFADSWTKEGTHEGQKQAWARQRDELQRRLDQVKVTLSAVREGSDNEDDDY